tara:strand:+ start:790 stop:1056 length:267 start_codon:yes stop_codon:yes gene_type:complete
MYHKMDKEDIETIIRILSKYIDVESFNSETKETKPKATKPKVIEEEEEEEDDDFSSETDSSSDEDLSDLEDEEFAINILQNGFHELTL